MQLIPISTENGTGINFGTGTEIGTPPSTERDTHLYGVAPGRVALELWRTTAPASRIGSTTRVRVSEAQIGALGRSSSGEGGLSEANP
jgi:hypothetical protein